MTYASKRMPALTPQQWQSRARAIQAELDGLSVEELMSGKRHSSLSRLHVGGSHGHGHDPNQPRVPAGHSDGGQWTSDGRGAKAGRFEFVDTGDEREHEIFDFAEPRVRFVASNVTIDWSEAFTGISSIDRTTLALGGILERTMQTMNFIPTWTPQAYGTAVHVAFGTTVRFAGLEGIGPQDVEHSFINQGSADYHGQPGSIRTDVVLRNAAGTVIAIYDVKTGGAKLTEARVRELRRKTGAGPNVPIIELHVSRGARLTRRLGTGGELGTITAQLANPSFRDNRGQGAFS